jgi:putative transposase
MPFYRRDNTPGATWFFIVVAFERRNNFCSDAFRTALRAAITSVRTNHPFAIDAWVLLPYHLHCVWTLPENDADFSTRWRLIKHHVSYSLNRGTFVGHARSASRSARGESTVWQRRFWEHRIRNDADLERHLVYLHFNPVKHGLVSRVIDWPHSSFHQFLQRGAYPRDWGSNLPQSALNKTVGSSAFD